MTHKTLILWTPILLLMGCASPAPTNPQELREVLGSWTGGEVLPYPRPDSQVVFLSLRPDNSLSLSMIFEVGPRSRVWTHDIDVAYGDGRISWDYHEGHLNPARDTMWVSKNYRGDRSEWMWVRDRGKDSLVTRLGSLQPGPFVLQTPPETEDGWETAEPDRVGLDPGILNSFLEEISEGKYGDIHSFLLVRDGLLAVEEYFAENGSKHGPFIASVFRDRPHHLASVSKAITSVLVGAAIDGGYLHSVEDPVADYLPQYASLFRDGREDITLEHLLTMSAGLEWSQSGRVRDHLTLWNTPDVLGYVLRKPLVARPGGRFVYSNGGAALLGAVLERGTRMSVPSFAEGALFRPLGIGEYLWTSYPDGTVETDGGLALRPRDLAKIGQLYLNRGEWNGAQLVPEDWVDRSTRGRFRFGSANGSPLEYGYFWIRTDLPFGESTIRFFFHGGDGCQYLAVIPELNMVVVFTAGVYESSPNRFFHAILREHVIPAIKLR